MTLSGQGSGSDDHSAAEKYERRLAWLRAFRGYAEDEAEIAAWAAAEIVRLRSALVTIKTTTKSGGAEAIARKALDTYKL